MISNDTTQWCRSIVERCEYKPGWEIHISDGDLFNLGEPILKIKFKTADSRFPDRIISVGMSHTVPEHVTMSLNKKRFIHWVLDMVMKVEIHEIKEWFKVDGEIFDDPHKER